VREAEFTPDDVAKFEQAIAASETLSDVERHRARNQAAYRIGCYLTGIYSHFERLIAARECELRA
jgi:hypothetical protein